MSVINARISPDSKNIKTQSIIIGASNKLTELSDIDSSQIEQGSLLIYDATLEIWKAKSTLDDGTYIECGHY
jgi:hypothetical protein